MVKSTKRMRVAKPSPQGKGFLAALRSEGKGSLNTSGKLYFVKKEKSRNLLKNEQIPARLS